MDFTAIDFETANFQGNSACSIGLVRCRSGEIVETFSSLIRPPRLYFYPPFTEIHGLTAADVRGAPTFSQLWREALRDFIGDDTLVAHNARFDAGVLSATLTYYGFPKPQNRWACSYRTAKGYFQREKGIQPLENYKLNTVAAHFGIQFRHHDALEDAEAAAKIMLLLPCSERHWYFLY